MECTFCTGDGTQMSNDKNKVMLSPGLVSEYLLVIFSGLMANGMKKPIYHKMIISSNKSQNSSQDDPLS